MVATGCLNWSQHSISHSTTSSSTSISSPSSRRRSFASTDVSFVRSPLFRSRSCETLISSKHQNSLKRIVSATFDSKYFEQTYFEPNTSNFKSKFNEVTDSCQNDDESDEPDQFVTNVTNWSGNMVTASIERKANRMELPFSLRMIQKKKQLEEGFIEAGEFAYCSMKKAFSSMVFIIRELQSYTLQMREALYVEDLHEILIRVHKEMNASFVWLFQQVFSHTPNLMVCVMILLADYSVYSMANHVAMAAPVQATIETVSTIIDSRDLANKEFDSSTLESFSVNFDGKTSSFNGINGGGGKFRQLSNGTDGDGEFEVGELWRTVEEEAEKMREVAGDSGIDEETRRRFVSPVSVKVEEDVDREEYMKTELVYQTGLLKEPNNPLLLANYAQFLYLFVHDHKRAEKYFKKASETEPKDAEALSKYASFLWHAKNDLWAAEETFLEAISADPSNSFYTANYAHFLWSNGADDTCFPLESPDNVNSGEVER